MDAAVIVRDPLFASLAFYSTVDILKMMAMGFTTGMTRVYYKAFANPEDVAGFSKETVPLNFNHPVVERIRRNHLNDIENIIPFVLIGIFYVKTGPSMQSALLHFRIFTAARFAHTLAYQLALPQPSRALAQAVSFTTCISMAIQVLRTSVDAL